MENLHDLKEAIRKQSEISFILEGELVMTGPFNSINDRIEWQHSGNNSTVSFSDIKNIIGEEKLAIFISEFEAKLRVEFMKVKEEREKELAKYRIVKDE